MMNLNKYNIDKYFFIVAGCFGVLSFWMWYQSFEGTLELLWQKGFFPLSILMFASGGLTLLTKPRSRVATQKRVHRNAFDLLNKFRKSILGQRRIEEGDNLVVRFPEFIEKSNRPDKNILMAKLNELYQQVPAVMLPHQLHDINQPYIDWHKYDLCIIAAHEDLELANAIRKKLLKLNSTWTVYLDVVDNGGVGELQEVFIKRVFYGSSRFCMALISLHVINNPRRKMELNYATRRVQYMKDQLYENYLMPIPIDQHSLSYMKGEKFLKEYAENIEVIMDLQKMQEIVVLKLSSLLDNGQSARAKFSNKSGESNKFTNIQSQLGVNVFVSFSNRDKVLRDELVIRLENMQSMGLITEWFDRTIVDPGSEMEFELTAYMEKADIILILVSPEYRMAEECEFVRNYILNTSKSEKGKTVFLPILMRPVIFDIEEFGKLKVLPQNGIPLTKWEDRDSAFLDIARGIMIVIEEIRA